MRGRAGVSLTRAVVVIVVLAGVLLAPVAARAESAACARINSGIWNQSLQSFSVGATISGFENGERLNFTVSGRGQLALLGASGSSFRSLLFVNPPGSGSFTVTVSFTTFRTLNDAVAAPLSVTATCTPLPVAPVPGGTATDVSRTEAVTRAFLAARINGILLNDPSATSLVKRLNSSVPQQSITGGDILGVSGMGLGADRVDEAAADAGAKPIQFSTSLSHLRRQAAAAQIERDRMALGAGDGGALPAVYAMPALWDAWIEGRYSAFDDDAASLDRGGHVGLLYFGADYRVSPDVIIGALVQLDWAQDTSSVYTSRVDGNGWMAGPYLSARLNENIYLDLRAAWGRSTNDAEHTNTETYASFDTSRWLLKGTLAGNWAWDAWRLTPSAELAFVTESQDTFTNSAGTLVPGQDVSLGRLQFGPEVGYRFAHTADLLVEPYTAVRGVWDFDSPNVAIIDGIVVGAGDFWGRLEGGLTVVTAAGAAVRGLAAWDGMGASDYNGYTLQGNINVPLN